MLTFDVLVDVAMNLQGSWLSARRHAPVMNRLHGLWSLGTVVGGLSSSRIAAAGISLPVHLVGAAAVLLAVIGVVSRGSSASTSSTPTTPTFAPASPEAPARSGRRPTSFLVLFLLAGFFAVAIESTSIEWAAFRFTDDFGTTAGFAALAYVAVTGGMTVGRFGGDWVSVRMSGPRLTLVSVVATGAGLGMASFSGVRGLSLAGYAIAGLGIATMLPTLYDTAAKHPGRPGVGLGALTAGLRIASLIIPLTVGTLAATGLSVGAAIVVGDAPEPARLPRRHDRPVRRLSRSNRPATRGCGRPLRRCCRRGRERTRRSSRGGTRATHAAGGAPPLRPRRRPRRKHRRRPDRVR